MKTTMRIEGFEDADHNLAQLTRMADRDELQELGLMALEPVATAARARVRERSGRLRRSIGVGLTLSPAQAALAKSDAGTVQIFVGAGALAQAITEEFGTVFEQAHPFMRPAWDGNVSVVFSKLRKGAAEKLRQLVKG